MQNKWYTKTIDEIFEETGSSEHGLDQDEAKKRLDEVGLNKLPGSKADSILLIFLRQFQSSLIYVLLLASIIVFIMGEIMDGSIILFVLVLNAVVGTIQEGRAQNTLLALKKFAQTNATILRQGKEMIIPDTEIAPGDIIILQEGEKVPADARVIESNNLKVDESILTGESEPIHKIEKPIQDEILGSRKPIILAPRAGEIPITRQKNIIFKGSNVVSGNGKAIVVATGLDTEIGRISKEVASIDTETPLKADIRHLSQFTILAVGIISVILFFIGILMGQGMREMFTTVVSLMVSIVPEGLPVVMTLVLAQGVWRMSKHNVLVKRLQAVGALGHAKIIAVDKTGTITKNEMMIQEVYIDKKIFKVKGSGYEQKGDILLITGKSEEKANTAKTISPPDFPELLLAGKVAAFCSSARVAHYEGVEPEHLLDNNDKAGIEERKDKEQKTEKDRGKEWKVSGDPTEAALLVFSQKIGFQKDDLLREYPLIQEVPFDYKTKYHAVTNMVDGRPFLMMVGAPEVVLNLSETRWQKNPKKQASGAGKITKLSKKEKEELQEVFIKMSQRGMRVLAFGIKNNAPRHLTDNHILDLTFVGFFGMKDALRPEVKQAAEKAASAGIKVVMITGDHELTAKTIAKEAGIFKTGDEVLTGEDVDELSDMELSKKLSGVSVFARVTPSHKLRIIEAYKQRGEIVAMTGDGVNDAPSLVAADLGVSMGKIGTEVAKEASDLVLLDDNFGSIISAVEEGRNIYKNIKKVILYLFSTNMGEVLAIVVAILLGYPLLLLPAQIIWLNLVTDGFLVIALAMEKKEDGLLKQGFKWPKKYFVDSLMVKRILVMSVPMMIGTLVLFKYYLPDNALNGGVVDFTKAGTMALMVLSVFQWFNAWNCRSETESVFKTNFFSNKFLVGALAIAAVFQVLAIYTPVMQKILHTTAISLNEWLIVIAISFSVIIFEEIRKFFYRRKKY